jgi:putative tricarboxylic transport membrane protein
MTAPQAAQPAPESQAASARSGLAVGEFCIALGALALAAVILWQTFEIPVSPLYAKVGPTVMPLFTAFGLGLLGALLMISALRGGWQTDEEKETTPDRTALFWVAAGLILNVLLISQTGFALASIVLFVCTARGFGSRAIVRDALIGLAFALVAYFGFAKTLGINIGAGIIENLLESIFFGKTPS